MNLFLWLSHFFERKHALIALLAIAFLAASFTLKYQFSADDYMQWGVFTAPTTLIEKQLILPNESNGFRQQISHQFNFFNQENGRQEAMKSWGAIPWWSDSNASLHLFRPISSITHWIDYQLWPNASLPMLSHSMFYYLLLITAVYFLYQRSLPSLAVAGIATLLIALDPSIKYAIAWVASRNALLAALFGVLAIISHIKWREENQRTTLWLLLTLLLALLSMLSAEGGIGLFAYIAAYALFLDKGSWSQRLLSLLPLALAIVAWRLGYQQAGYGAQNISQYIDPGEDPLYFVQHALGNIPLLLFQQFVGIDNLDRTISPTMKQTLTGIAFGVVLLLTLLFFKLIAKNKHARFWGAGMLMATVPPCALAHTDGRVMFFIALGAFPLITLYLQEVFATASDKFIFSKPTWLRRASAATFVYVYVVIAAIGHTTMTAYAYGFTKPHTDKQPLIPRYDYETAIDIKGNEHLIVLSSPSPFMAMYYPYHAAYLEKNIPLTARVIAPALSRLEVQRISKRQYRVIPEGGFLITSKSELPNRFSDNAIHTVHNARNMMGFYRRNQMDFNAQQTLTFPELSIQVEATEKGRPLAIIVTLNPAVVLDQVKTIYWDWQTKQYIEIKDFDEGQSLTLAGPFSQYDQQSLPAAAAES